MKSGWMAIASLLLLGVATGASAQNGTVPSAPYVPTPAQQTAFAAAKAQLERWTRPALTPFASEAEIRRWLTDARAAREAMPRDPSEGQEIVLIEPRAIARGSADVTVPVHGVDQGDAVRQAGRFLLILSGGSLSVFDTGAAPGDPVSLADDEALIVPSSTLLDSILIHGNRVIVVGRAGQGGAVLIAAFRLGTDGQLTHDGTYLVSGQDDARVGISGDRLVIYSSTDVGYWGASNPEFEWPHIRRWTAAAAQREAALAREEDRSGTSEGSVVRNQRAAGPGRLLLGAGDIYRPVAATTEGELHLVSVCPLASLTTREGLACRSTGFAGAAVSRYLLTASHAYLLLTQAGSDRGHFDPLCPTGPGGQPQRSWLYRVPLDGGHPEIAGLTGEPGFPGALTERSDQVLLPLGGAWRDCEAGPIDALANVPRGAFGGTAAMVRPQTYADLEDFASGGTLFAESEAVAFRSSDYATEQSELTLAPFDRPDAKREIELPHGTGRVEPVGGGVLVVGLNAEERLAVSFIRPGMAAPSTVAFPDATADRSNGYASAAFDGLIGLPSDRITDERTDEGRRRDSPDIQFLRIAADGGLTRAGTLAGSRAHGCGDCGARLSRTIFMNGRIFALAGAELIEGRLENGQVRELRRFDIYAALQARAAERRSSRR